MTCVQCGARSDNDLCALCEQHEREPTPAATRAWCEHNAERLLRGLIDSDSDIRNDSNIPVALTAQALIAHAAHIFSIEQANGAF